jgi:hypothetical protein
MVERGMCKIQLLFQSAVQQAGMRELDSNGTPAGTHLCACCLCTRSSRSPCCPPQRLRAGRRAARQQGVLGMHCAGISMFAASPNR